MSLVIQGVPVLAERVTTYNTVAATMFTFHDYMLTFPDEVELIWRSKYSWVNALFYIIRYLILFIRTFHLVFCTNVFGMVPIGPSGCLLWQWFQALSGQVLFLAVETLLITRVYAYYGRSKVILASLLILLAAESSAIIVLISTSLPSGHIIQNPLHNIQAGPCIGVSIPVNFSSIWAPPLIMQGIVSILVAVKFIKAQLNAQIGSPPLLTVFVRDHTWAFLLIFAVSLWCTLAYELTLDQGEVALTWIYSTLGFCGTRLILNLRSAARDNTENHTAHDVSDIKFTTNMEGWMSHGAGSATPEREVEARKEGMQI